MITAFLPLVKLLFCTFLHTEFSNVIVGNDYTRFDRELFKKPNQILSKSAIHKKSYRLQGIQLFTPWFLWVNPQSSL